MLAVVSFVIVAFASLVNSFRIPRMILARPFALSMSTSSTEGMIMRRVDQWACVKDCGACCKLGPLDSRPDLDTYLTPSELTLYKSMVGVDDWCINYDKQTRMCTIYDTRFEVYNNRSPRLSIYTQISV